MAKELVSDELWELVEPLDPGGGAPLSFRRGRKRIDDRREVDGDLVRAADG